jgi:hypothetical protein
MTDILPLGLKRKFRFDILAGKLEKICGIHFCGNCPVTFLRLLAKNIYNM